MGSLNSRLPYLQVEELGVDHAPGDVQVEAKLGGCSSGEPASAAPELSSWETASDPERLRRLGATSPSARWSPFARRAQGGLGTGRRRPR